MTGSTAGGSAAEGSALITGAADAMIGGVDSVGAEAGRASLIAGDVTGSCSPA
jgi:hypothetical protein